MTKARSCRDAEMNILKIWEQNELSLDEFVNEDLKI